MEKPLIALTMGDPCGVGPEIIVAALADPSLGQLCRPLVLGDRGALERAVAVTGLPVTIETVQDTGPLKTQPGVIYLRLTSVPPDAKPVLAHARGEDESAKPVHMDPVIGA